MNVDLSDEAVEFGTTVRRALEAAGGDELVQMARPEAARHGALVTGVLDELGAWDLAPRKGGDDLEAAAAVCRSAGWWGLPYPVAERLARPGDVDAAGLVVVAETVPVGRITDEVAPWVAVTVGGTRRVATARRSSTAWVYTADLDLEPVGDTGAGDVALALVLPCWTLLGMLDRAIALTSAYVRQRRQFGQPLASFQGVQFQLADAEVERAGLEELAKYALWASTARPDDAADDALALRLAAIEAADAVFRTAHQLHGAIGFCDEAVLSWLSRASQPLRRLPWGLSGTRDVLARRVGRRGLSGLFDDAVLR